MVVFKRPMEMLRTPLSLLVCYGVFVLLWFKRLLGQGVGRKVVDDVRDLTVRDLSKEAEVSSEGTESPSKIQMKMDDLAANEKRIEDVTEQKIPSEEEVADSDGKDKDSDEDLYEEHADSDDENTESDEQNTNSVEDFDGKDKHPKGFLTKFPGSDFATCEGSVKYMDKQMMLTRGLMWDITPQPLLDRYDVFNIMATCLYFPNSIDWQADLTAVATVSCGQDPSVRVTSKVIMKTSNLEKGFTFYIAMPIDWDYDKWLSLDSFKIDLLVENFEGHCDSLPTKRVINVEDPSLRHDRVLIVEGRKIYVQSGILSMWSEYFNAMFNSSFKEAGMNEIALDCVSADEFIEMLQVIYPSEKPITVESLESLLALADLLIMPYLTAKCCLFIGSVPEGTIDEAKIRHLNGTYRLLEGEDSSTIDEILSSYGSRISWNWNKHFESKFDALPLDLEDSTVQHDRVIVIEGRRIHVQSAILVSYSSYFASLFDSIEDPTQDIPLTDVSADEFTQLLHCLYPCGTPDKIYDMEVLLRLAKHFEIPSLTERCSLHLCTLQYRGMQLIPMAELAFEYKLDQVKAWLFAQAARGLHGCMQEFAVKNRQILTTLPKEEADFFDSIFSDWRSISCPDGSLIYQNPKTTFKLGKGRILRGVEDLIIVF